MEPFPVAPSLFNIYRVFMRLLEISNAEKSFGARKILDRISFTCRTGGITGIFGRNGSGKSTLMKMIFGTTKADSIEIKVDEQKLAPSEVIPSQMIGYLPQDSFLPKESKVRDIIPLFFPKGEEQDKIFYAEGIAAFDNRKIGKLSAGQLKYLEVLLLGHLRHPFLFLDEPFSLVEPSFIEKIKEFLISLKDHKGIVVTDHYYADVLDISTENFVIKHGKKFAIDNEEDLMKHEYLKSAEER